MTRLYTSVAAKCIESVGKLHGGLRGEGKGFLNQWRWKVDTNGIANEYRVWIYVKPMGKRDSLPRSSALRQSESIFHPRGSSEVEKCAGVTFTVYMYIYRGDDAAAPAYICWADKDRHSSFGSSQH